LATTHYSNIIASVENGVGLVRLNRPKVLNALSFALVTVAVRSARESILKALDAMMETDRDFELGNLYLLFATRDKEESMRAFLEKRKPVFQGR
jgi:enoyl-CoA hydratase/carnithine racemase